MSELDDPIQESANRSFIDNRDEESSVTRDWLEEFEASAHRSLEVRMRYSFIHTYKPVMDDATYRSFDTMEDYRRWCEQNLPSWFRLWPRLNILTTHSHPKPLPN